MKVTRKEIPDIAMIRAAFGEVYGWTEDKKPMSNLMTPDVVKYGSKHNFFWEISKGKGIFGKDIYGVTVLEKRSRGFEKRHDLNTCFSDYEEALNYARKLKEK